MKNFTEQLHTSESIGASHGKSAYIQFFITSGSEAKLLETSAEEHTFHRTQQNKTTIVDD